MGIINLHIRKINQLLHEHFEADVEKKIAIIGFPDLHQNVPLLEELFGQALVQRSKVNGTAQLIELLNMKFNARCTVFDIHKHRGIETVLNLNEPLPIEFNNQFDFVIDSSCLEHCFNIAQAFKNLCEFVKVGGIVTTVAPVYDFNHGYFNVNPLFHEDGFRLNGFEILSQNVIDNVGDIVKDFGAKTHPRKTYILSTAKKNKECIFEYPIQTSKPKNKKYDESKQ